jgi:hypothetical protein
MLKGVGGKGKDKGKDKPEGKGKGKDKGNSAWGREHFCRSRETKDLPAHGARSLTHGQHCRVFPASGEHYPTAIRPLYPNARRA